MKTLKEMFRIEHRECNAAEGFALIFLTFFVCIPVWAFPFARDYHQQVVDNRSLAWKMDHAKPSVYDKCPKCQDNKRRGMPLSISIRQHDAGQH